jgi:signal transduction histidine kinase/HPt (histidine-containing phosphotransfer) domain-containing protein
MLGVDQGTLIKQRISRFILKEDQDIYYLHHKRLFETHSAPGLGSVQANPGQTGKPQACELRMVKNDGTSFWAHLAATVRQDSGAEPASFIVISDITERKLAEAEVQDALEYAENIVETVSEPLLVLNHDLKILTANRSFYDTFKVTRVETVGSFVFDLGNRQWDIPGLRTLLEEILPKENIFNGYEVEHDFPDIGFKTILLNARQIFRKNIGSHIILLAMEDITKRKLAEAEIQDALEYAENIIETVREPLLVLTPDLKILTANRSFYDSFKVTHEETVANFIFDIGNRQWDIPGLRVLLEEILPNETIFNGYEVEHDFPDIGFKTILLNARQIFRKKIGSHLILLAMEDITERKQAEVLQETNRQLEVTTAQAEMANAAKTTFLANMSHEIRTPLSGMLGMTGLLRETPLTERQQGYAEKIKSSGESLLAVLNDILDFSEVEAGKLHLEIVPFSLKEVIGNVVNIFESQAAEKKIAINTTIDPELPAALMGDPQRMTQVIANLMGNAVKFTEAGCIQLGVKVRRRTETDVELKISVQDTGIGMTEEELSRLFMAFSQADASTARRFGGSGLGLAISRQFVELMGGTIHAESTPGKGSLFTVVLSFLVNSDIGRTNWLRCLDTRRIKLPQEKHAAEEMYLFTKQKLVPIPLPADLDVEEGLNLVGGDPKSYLKLLRDFVAECGETPSLLLHELQANRREDAIHRVHAIRSIASNLGGKEMEAAAAELENACQDYDENEGSAENGVPLALREPLRVFIDRLEALIAAIGIVLVQQPAVLPDKPEGRVGSAAELSPLLERLKLALASEEPLPCMEILEELSQRRWSEDHETALAEVNRLVQQYRLAEALAFLKF